MLNLVSMDRETRQKLLRFSKGTYSSFLEARAFKRNISSDYPIHLNKFEKEFLDIVLDTEGNFAETDVKARIEKLTCVEFNHRFGISSNLELVANNVRVTVPLVRFLESLVKLSLLGDTATDRLKNISQKLKTKMIDLEDISLFYFVIDKKGELRNQEELTFSVVDLVPAG